MDQPKKQLITAFAKENNNITVKQINPRKVKFSHTIKQNISSLRGISTKLIHILLLILLLVVGSVIISGYPNIMGNNSNTKTSTGGNFENQWVKFQYPSQLVILDKSNSTHFRVEIYNSTNTTIENMVGEVFNYQSNRTDLSYFTRAKRIIIADKSGIKIEDGLLVCSYVFLSPDYINTKTMILNFDARNHRDTYQKIADTIVVKKVPG